MLYGYSSFEQLIMYFEPVALYYCKQIVVTTSILRLHGSLHFYSYLKWRMLCQQCNEFTFQVYYNNKTVLL